jgi:hypothetical protein
MHQTFFFILAIAAIFTCAHIAPVSQPLPQEPSQPQVKKTEPNSSELIESEEKPKLIIPMVEIAPGETKTITLASPLSMMSRGSGLGLMLAESEESQGEFREWPSKWEADGITISVLSSKHVAAKASDWAPQYATLTNESLYPFEVTIAVDKRVSTPSKLEMLVRNATCGGTANCQFCIFVTDK